jgi:hypothetical protein
MIDDYKRAVDNIKASKQLENKTIKLIMDKANENVKHKGTFTRKSNRYKINMAAACLLLAILAAAAFYKGTILSNNKVSESSKNSKIENPIAIEQAADKKVKEYSPDSVQARIMKEEAVSFDGSALADRMAPKNKNIKDRYANSQNVIKGYIYSTEYFWSTNELFSDLYTKSVVVVEKSYKGALKPGDKFTIIEIGGITTLKDWIEKTSYKEKKDFEKIPENYDPYQGKNPNTLVDYAGLLGIKPMRPAQEVVLFLVSDSYEFFGKNGEPGYRLVESDGGKMVLEDGRYETKIAPEDIKAIKPIIEAESCAENEIDNLMKYAQGGN